MTHDDPFVESIVEASDDDAPRLIYADWLEEHDDPDRAAFIPVQIELARLPEGDPRREERAAGSMSWKLSWNGASTPTVTAEGHRRRGHPNRQRRCRLRQPPVFTHGSEGNPGAVLASRLRAALGGSGSFSPDRQGDPVNAFKIDAATGERLVLPATGTVGNGRRPGTGGDRRRSPGADPGNGPHRW